MAQLNLYNDNKGREYIAIVTDRDFSKELQGDGFKVVETIILLDNDVANWPTNRLLKQE